MTPPHARLTWGLILVPVFAGCLSCPFNPPDRPPPIVIPEGPYKPPTSISNILENLRLSYTSMDDVAYAELLDEN